MRYEVPHGEKFEITTIVLDLNGTLSVRGEIPARVPRQLAHLKELGFDIVLFTGDQRGTAVELCRELGIELKLAGTSDEKEILMKEYESETTAAIGNARIDIGTFKRARLSIATLQAEGIHAGILKHVDVIVPSIEDALELFIDADSFKATMRV